MTEPELPEGMRVFDRRLVRARRDRWSGQFAEHDFLFREVADRLADRLQDTTRRFPLALDLGSRAGILGRVLAGRGGVERLVQAELSERLARGAVGHGAVVVADEESLPFADASFDLVLSCLSLHWANDLPGALTQARRALKPDGLFLAALFGLGTLGELRQALLEAEIDTSGGAGPRVSPFTELRDGAALLQRAGLALPVADADTITVTYPNALALMRDLARMGEANATHARPRRPLRRSTLMRAATIYADRHGGPDGRVPARFQVIYLTGWAPHPRQPKALKPGSARHRLAGALDTAERPAGDKARPR
ncbi:MAG: methyltransferase domain-containing protein [Alphaproteobacteria bacterium]|nr:methyltransferase domain-containing protein [Alphaproteobacteria bacterium]